MPSAPSRLFRPDFRTILKNLPFSEREIRAQTMDATYDIITKTVDDEALDETHTALLVMKYVQKVHESQKCFEVIMGAIWPPLPKQYCFVFDTPKVTDPAPASDPEVEISAEGVEHALGVKGPDSSYSYWLQPPNIGLDFNDDEDIYQHFQLPGIGHHRGSGTFLGRGAPRGQPSSRGRGRGALRGGGSAFTPNPASNYHFTRNISYYPMPSGNELKREYAFTELSAPGAQTIILGPLPPPTLPSHVRTSTLPPGHPPQSYGPGAFPPSYNIPGASSSNPNPGVASGIIEEDTSTSSTHPVASAESPDPSEISKKRSRDDGDDEEETTRPSARLRIEAPPPPSLPDDTIAREAPAAFSPVSPSGNDESRSDNDSPKKRIRDGEEDEEETARPSTRMRQEPPAIRPRHPSPTPSDRRIGRIIAPFGTSIRFNPRPSPEADIGSLGAARDEGNRPNNLPASSSGSSILPLVSFDSPSSSRSSQRIKGMKAKTKEVSKKE